MAIQQGPETITGASCTGNSGDPNRTYTLTESNATATGMLIFLNRSYLYQGASYDYTVSGQTVTFLIAIDNGDTIQIYYYTSDPSASGTYCTVAEVRNELDGITTSDISDARITACIGRAEAFIDLETQNTFKQYTVTNEFYDTSDEQMWVSPQSRMGFATGGLARSDGIMSGWLDTIQLKNKPLISISALSRNIAGTTATDSFEALTEQTGSGGDYVSDDRTGTITFLNKHPYIGKKRAFKISYIWGLDRSATDNESERKTALTNELAILLTVRQILSMKGSASQFSGVDNISLESISISKGISSTVEYLNHQTERIKELFAALGVFNTKMGL